MKPLILALQFLTRLYIPIAIDFSPENLRKSLFFFPWVGALIGLVLYLPVLILEDPSLRALATLLIWIFLTGGLHLDGLSDMADGFLSGKEKDKILEIMKDSRVGAFGVISLILIILSKYVLLSETEAKIYTYPLILGGARFANALAIGLAPSARKDGMGRMFQETRPLPYIMAGGLLFLVFMISMDKRFLFCFLAQIGLVLYTSLVSYKKIGGLTGDVYGANAELGEALGLFVWRLIQ